MSQQPIAGFDSGLGGLSVVRHLRSQLPAEDIVYFGDTARVPYGTKSAPTVCAFSLECARFLMQFDPKMLIVACNTASALALDALQRELPLEIVGVVEPGARAARAIAAGGCRIVVLGTEATIASGAYLRALRTAGVSAADVESIACPLFVPVVEEGRDVADPVVDVVVASYLSGIRGRGALAVVLGCTHYPLLAPALARYLGADARIVDSGHETALEVQRRLTQQHLLRQPGAKGQIRTFVSDNPDRFRRVGERFLGEQIAYVELIESERYTTPGRLAAADA